MRKSLDYFNTLLLTVLMCIMVVSALMQVFSRVVSLNLQFTEELTIYSMIWVTLFGAAYTFGLKKHVAIDLLSASLNVANKKRLRIVIESIIIIFTMLIMVIGGIRFVWITFKLGQVTSVMHIPKGWIYLALPVSGLIIVIYNILNILEELKQRVLS